MLTDTRNAFAVPMSGAGYLKTPKIESIARDKELSFCEDGEPRVDANGDVINEKGCVIFEKSWRITATVE